MATVSYMAIDGSSVNISMSAYLPPAFTSMVVAKVDGVLHQFTTGPFLFGEEIASDFDVTLDEEYQFEGGRLRLGSAVQVDPDSSEHLFALGVWEGSSFCVETGFYEVTHSYLIDLFARFSLSETSSGLSLRARDPQSTPFETGGGRQPLLVKVVPGFGFLEIWQRTAEAGELLPPWQGSFLPGGELFLEGQTEQHRVFILAGANAITRIYADRDLPKAESLALLSTLDVNWKSVGRAA